MVRRHVQRREREPRSSVKRTPLEGHARPVSEIRRALEQERRPPRILRVVPVARRWMRLDLECGHLVFVGPECPPSPGGYWPCLRCPPVPFTWSSPVTLESLRFAKPRAG